MKIKIEDTNYTLDTDRAKQLGVLKKIVEKPKPILLTQDEAAVLYAITSWIGGDSRGARGCTDSIRIKIRDVFGANPSTDLSLERIADLDSIYFKN